MKNIISIILGILMFLKLMELLYGAIFLDKPLNPITKIIFILTLKSSPDSCVKCYTMFLPFLLIKIDVFS